MWLLVWSPELCPERRAARLEAAAAPARRALATAPDLRKLGVGYPSLSYAFSPVFHPALGPGRRAAGGCSRSCPARPCYSPRSAKVRGGLYFLAGEGIPPGPLPCFLPSKTLLCPMLSLRSSTLRWARALRVVLPPGTCEALSSGPRGQSWVCCPRIAWKATLFPAIQLDYRGRQDSSTRGTFFPESNQINRLFREVRFNFTPGFFQDLTQTLFSDFPVGLASLSPRHPKVNKW
ncbi:uncharacterized protein LOC109118552 [Fukomys damarensis]|uniref:uncharacterized protein LOC109118552 n=1 Tax=Fukomys damarensis TaxID=885580 RepID=UPI0008FEC2F0|nr:uncharacterized protein LOC109118552 [Fukomys damarensis]